MSRTHDSECTALESAVASAANVDVVTRWIFLECQMIGLIELFLLCAISWRAAKMNIPWRASGVRSDAKEASEKATYRNSFTGIGRMQICVWANFLASWSVRLASNNVLTLAVLIWLWRDPNRLPKSGLVLWLHTEGYL